MTTPATIQVYRKDKNAILPTRAHSTDAGWDVSACLMTESGRPSKKMIPEKNTILIPTGLIVKAPAGHFLQVCSRSGLAKSSIFVANAPGIIDPDYSGELMILLFNGGYRFHMVEHGHRIAQLICTPIVQTEIWEAGAPPKSVGRGTAGFGSTGP